MSAKLRIERVGPLTTIQDAGRFGFLSDGVSASGPMDCGAFRRAGILAGSGDGAGIEFSMLGISLSVIEGHTNVGWDGGVFEAMVNDEKVGWPEKVSLIAGDSLAISPGARGNYGYLRFGGDIEVPMVMGSKATSLRARIGGLEGRALRAGDVISIAQGAGMPAEAAAAATEQAPIRFVWGLHADVFERQLREHFITGRFRISSMMDRMGVRLRDEGGVFAGSRILSLVSDPVVCGDIQILGDGTPIVLGRDHQPTGGYPRIGTVVSADLDRFFQLRPNAEVEFAPIGPEQARALLRSGGL